LSSTDAVATAMALGNAVHGRMIFNTAKQTDNGSWACSICHSVTPDQFRVIGPGLWNISVRGANLVSGENAVEYIRESIVDPNAFIAPADPAYPSNLMPSNYGLVLSPQDLNDVIAYLLTLHN